MESRGSEAERAGQIGQTEQGCVAGTEDERAAQAVRRLYQQVLEGWNARSGEAFAAPFTEDGESIGFDGSVNQGREEIAATLNQIFAHHMTAAYVAKVRGVRLLGADAAILRAVVGMVSRGQTTINPAVNALQTVVATRRDGVWRVALLQTTPAQFHGRPELARELTEELQRLVDDAAGTVS